MCGERGRGVVTTRHFTAGDFVVEYCGDLTKEAEALYRENLYAASESIGCYMFYFRFNDEGYW